MQDGEHTLPACMMVSQLVTTLFSQSTETQEARKHKSKDIPSFFSFPCKRMDFLLPIASRRREHLAASLHDLGTEVRVARQALRQARHQKRRREVARSGQRRKNQLILLRIIRRFLPNEALPLCIAKLLLPGTVWEQCVATDPTSEAAHLERLLAQRKIKDEALKVWSHPREPKNMRMLRKAKRLATEQRMFTHVLLMNGKGVTPKQADLMMFMAKAWPITGDPSDDVPNHIALRRRWTEKWFVRFRRFWHVAFSRLQIREAMSEEVQALKVRGVGPNLTPKWVPNLDPKREPLLGTPVIELLTEAPKSDPKLGPSSGSQLWAKFGCPIPGCGLLEVGPMAVGVPLSGQRNSGLEP